MTALTAISDQSTIEPWPASVWWVLIAIVVIAYIFHLIARYADAGREIDDVLAYSPEWWEAASDDAP